MMDLTCYAEELPEAGQTLIGELFTTGFGGKGANQAVMAANCLTRASLGNFIPSINFQLVMKP